MQRGAPLEERCRRRRPGYMETNFHTRSGSSLALVTVIAGIAVAAAQALGGLPPDLVCKVPDVRGLSLADAKRELVQAKCKTGWTTRAYSTKVKKGGVIDEVPGPGYRIRRGTEIDLTVSRGARM